MKKYLSALLLLFLSNVLFAAYLRNMPVELKQPDGEILQCFATGDEYHFRIHDAKGYTLLRHPQTGWVVYAVEANGDIVASDYVAGTVDPATLNIAPNIDISPEKHLQLRQQFWNSTPKLPNATPKATNALRTGTLNNIVIYIAFADETGFSHTRTQFENLFISETEGQSLYSYYRDISNGSFLIPSTFYPHSETSTVLFYQDSHPRSYYQPYNAATNPDGYQSSQVASREHAMLKAACEYVKTEVEAIFTAADLDYDSNGVVDNVCFVITGNAGEWSSLLWPHRWSLYTQSTYFFNKRIYDYNLILENHLFTVSNGKQSVLVHETYHTLGAPDLYTYSTSLAPVESWDVMCLNTIPPQSSGAYITSRYGRFINEIPTITETGTYTLYEIFDRNPDHPVAWRINCPNSDDGEYYVLEYRRKTGGRVYESALPGEGIIITRINPTVGDGNASSDGTANYPYGVYVVRPGATNNTMTGQIANAYFSAQSGRTAFSDYTSPKAFLSNGQPALLNISIEEISTSGGETMTFHVTFPEIGTPSATAATNIFRTGFTANWNEISNATAYLLSVYYKDGNNNKIYDGGGLNDFNTGKVSTFNVENLDRSKSVNWFFSVKSVTADGTSNSSNEIPVKLADFNPVTCAYSTNIQTGETPNSWQTGNSYNFGHNSMSYTGYAEYYSLPEMGKISGVKINVARLQNNSNNNNYARVTFRVWDKNQEGKPGNVLYTETIRFSRLKAGEQEITFGSQTLLPNEFFVGFELYYHADNPDIFALYATDNRGTGGENHAYILDGELWKSATEVYSGIKVSMFIEPNLCTFVPVASFNISQEPGTTTIAFENTSKTSGPSVWLWSFGDGTTSVEKDPLHVYPQSGTYHISFRAENEFGASISGRDIEVLGKPKTNFSANKTKDCTSLTVQFQNYTAEPVETVYLWDFGDGETSAEKNPIHTYNEVKSYNVALRATTAYGDSLIVKPGFVSVLLPPEISGIITNEVNQGGNGKIEINITGGTPPYTYKWSNDSVCKDLYNLTAGEYTLTVTDAAKCTVVAVFIVSNGAGVANNPASQYRIYPNPASTVIAVACSEPLSVTIYSLLGKRVLTEKIEQSRQINIEHLPAGVYVIELNSQNGETVRQQILVE